MHFYMFSVCSFVMSAICLINIISLPLYTVYRRNRESVTFPAGQVLLNVIDFSGIIITALSNCQKWEEREAEGERIEVRERRT